MSLRSNQQVGENYGVAIGGDHHGPVNIYPKDDDSSIDECLRSLLLTDPREDREQILRRKDELLSDTCDWVCHDEAFTTWWEAQKEDENSNQLLWLHGGAGKGKTMIMIALSREIGRRIQQESAPAAPIAMAYYFCQSASTLTNHAQAILRGLIYFLVTENKHLVKHVLERYRISGSKFYEGAASLDGLWTLLKQICADPSLSTVYLLVDALDECDNGLGDLLKMISRSDLALPSKVKWLVSSRNESQISRALASAADRPHISLEVNASRVSRAIERYIQVKTQDRQFLWSVEPDVASSVRSYLSSHANGTFLWVWLVCQELQNINPWDDALAEVQKFPSGLHQVYARMSQRVEQSKAAHYCFALLQAAEVTPRPMSLDEAWFIADLPRQQFQNRKTMEELVRQCASFFVIRDDILTFVHKSASDYLRSPSAEASFRLRLDDAHFSVCLRSFELMRSSLRQDLCNLSSPGALIEDVEDGLIQRTIPKELQYACLYWGHHLLYVGLENPGGPSMHTLISLFSEFLQKGFIYWVECMSLLQEIASSIRILLRIESYLAHFSSNMGSNFEAVDVAGLLFDARRFVSEFRHSVEEAPLQVYHAGLLHCPRDSELYHNFKHLQDGRVAVHPPQDLWGSCSYTLEGHSDAVISVAISSDDKKIASASLDGTAQIWSASDGELICTLEGHTDGVLSVAFSPDNKLVVSASQDTTARCWDVTIGKSLHVLAGHTDRVISAVFCSDGSRVASASVDETVIIWDVSSGQLLYTLKGFIGALKWVDFSPNGKHLACTSFNNELCMWESSTGKLLNTFPGVSGSHGSITFTKVHWAIIPMILQFDGSWLRIYDMMTGLVMRQLDFAADNICLLAISPDSELIASKYKDNGSGLLILDASSGDLRCKIEAAVEAISSVVFAPNGRQIASATHDGTIRIWDSYKGQLLHLLEGHTAILRPVRFSSDGRQLVSASYDRTVRIWDILSPQSPSAHEKHTGNIYSMILSLDQRNVITASEDFSIRIWDAATGQIQYLLQGHTDRVVSIALSPDGSRLASGSDDATVRLWDISTGSLIHTLVGDESEIRSIAFSSDGKYVASASLDLSVFVWDLTRGAAVHEFRTQLGSPVLDGPYVSNLVVFSPDGNGLVHADRSFIRLWNVETGQCLQEIKFATALLGPVIFSPDGALILSGCNDGTVRLWDIAQTQPPRIFTGHTCKILSLTCSSDGKRIASVSHDGQVFIWDMSTGMSVQQIEGLFPSSTLHLRSLLGWDADKWPGATPDQISHMSADRKWLIRKGCRVLWIPHSLRPDELVATPHSAVLASGSGRVTFLFFKD